MNSSLTDLAPQLQAKATAFVKEHRLPGAAVGVVHGDELVWSAGIGFADRASGRSSDTAGLYRIASITKTFTGTAIMQLRDDGKLHLDDPAVAYLPELREGASPFGAIETVTLRRLLSHESGLMGDPPDADFSAGIYEGLAERNLARAADIGTRIPPNVHQKYSNLGFQLLGEIVARVSGRPYVDHVRERILEPLRMSGSGFDPLDEPLSARCATGYDSRWLSDELGVAAPMPTIFAEGGLWSCVEDLARWISAQIASGDGGVLVETSLKEMHTARYLGDETWTEAWCIAWYAARRGEVIWVQHSGGLPGFITNICFDPKERVGAIVLLNGGTDAAELSMDLAGLARDAVRSTAPGARSADPDAGNVPVAPGPLCGPCVRHPDALGMAGRSPDPDRSRPAHVAPDPISHRRPRCLHGGSRIPGGRRSGPVHATPGRAGAFPAPGERLVATV